MSEPFSSGCARSRCTGQASVSWLIHVFLDNARYHHAKLVQQWQDIAAELPPQISASLLPPPFSERKKETAMTERLAFVPEGLSPAETCVFKLLTPDSPAHVDWLFDNSELPISELTAALLSLEIRELVRALPGRCFVRKL